MNKDKTCACQGNDAKKEGASYTFGCSWNVYHDGCKFAKNESGHVRKFKLTHESQVRFGDILVVESRSQYICVKFPSRIINKASYLPRANPTIVSYNASAVKNLQRHE
jgi:hypothetical protein